MGISIENVESIIAITKIEIDKVDYFLHLYVRILLCLHLKHVMYTSPW